MATVSGFITIADITDGITGASIVASNEAHTFVAGSEGAITASEAGMFSNTFRVYVGSGQYTFLADASNNTGATPGNNQFSIPSDSVSGNLPSGVPANSRLVEGYTVSPSGVDVNVYVSPSGEITIRDRNTASTTGFFDDGGANSMSISIPIVVDIGGVDTTYTKVLSFSKALGGSAPYVRMVASRQTVNYGFGEAAPKTGQANLLLTANTFNPTSSAGTGVWAYQLNGTGNFTTISSLTGHTIAGAATDTSTLTITSAGYDGILGTNDTITYRFTRDSRQDQITIAKIEDASGGLNTILQVSGGVTVFKNNVTYSSTDSQTYCDLTAIVQRGTSTVAHADVTSYRWKKNGSNFNGSVTQPTGTGANAYGGTSRNIRIAAADVADNGSDLFSCDVVVPDA